MQTSFVNASIDALIGRGAAEQYRAAEAAKREKAGKAALEKAVPTNYPISHTQTEAHERHFGRYTLVLKGLSSEPDVSNLEQASLLKQINAYVQSRNLCEKEHLILKMRDDPLKAYDPATREAKFRISCVI